MRIFPSARAMMRYIVCIGSDAGLRTRSRPSAESDQIDVPRVESCNLQLNRVVVRAIPPSWNRISSKSKHSRDWSLSLVLVVSRSVGCALVSAGAGCFDLRLSGRTSLLGPRPSLSMDQDERPPLLRPPCAAISSLSVEILLLI